MVGLGRTTLAYCRTNWSWVESQTQRDDREERSRVVHREYHQHLEEPAPDYPRATPTPSPPPPPPLVDTKKKVYQRTRFAADIPPARVKATQTAHKPTLGESFRKFVGKFRSSSKEKRRGKKGSRSPSPQAPTYQQYDGVDVEGEGEGEGEPVAPPRSRYQAAMRRAGTDRDPVVTRYYLGEDPFGGSIYGREREYDGATPFRRKHRRSDEEERNARNQQLTNGGSSSTLGRFSKSTSRLVNERHTNGHQDRGGVQTLPRKLHDDRPKKQVYVTRSNVERVTTSSPSWERQQISRLNGNHPNSHSMINVSVVNQASPPPPVGPAKPARTYRSLLRSKSFNVHAGDGLADHLNGGVHKSNPQLHRLDESPPPLKSPGIVTSISRSTKDLSRAVDDDYERTAFDFDRKPYVNSNSRTVHETKKKIFMKNLQDRAPELFRTLHGAEEERRPSPVDERPGRLYTSTPLRNGHRVLEYSGSYRSSGTSSPLDRVHSPTYSTSVTHSPTVRNGSGEVVNRSVVRRGSGDDYSETVHITSKSEDPLRPSVTDTVQSFTKKTLPGKGGRSKGTIESSETKTVTKSRYRGGERDLKYIEGSKYAPRNGGERDLKYIEGSKYAPRNGGVTIEVRNNKLF